MCRCMLSIVLYHTVVKHVKVNVVHAILYKTLDNIHLHMFECAILYKPMDNIHVHMFDCAIL
jgi:hypothetical protein